MSRNLFLIYVLFISMLTSAQSKKELADSLDVIREKLEFNPDSAELQLQKASLNIQLGQFEYARYEYDKVLRRYPNNLTALFFRAYVNMRMRRYNFARSDYRRVLTLVPGNYEAQMGLAVLNQRENKYREALDIINRMTSDFPDSAEVYAVRAGIEKDNEMYELAELDYAEALKRDADNNDYLISRADVLIRLGRIRDALSLLDELVRRGVPKASLKEYYERCRD